MDTHTHVCVHVYECSSSSSRFPTGTEFPVQPVIQMNFAGEVSLQVKIKDFSTGPGEEAKELGPLTFSKTMLSGESQTSEGMAICHTQRKGP